MIGKLRSGFLVLFCFCYMVSFSQGKPDIIMTTTKKIGSEMCISLHSDKIDGAVKIDCGDGTLVERAITDRYDYYNNSQCFELKGPLIKIYSKSGAITQLACAYKELTSLDVSNCKSLQSLSCQGNELTSLDVSKNKNLEKIYCFDNKFSLLDLSGNLLIDKHSVNEHKHNVEVKFPDEDKSVIAKQEVREKEKATENFRTFKSRFGLAVSGGYLSMPFTQQGNHTHYQNMWHIETEILYNFSGNWNQGSSVERYLSLDEVIYFLPISGRNRALPSLGLCYSEALKEREYSIDFRVMASLYHVNPSIGLNLGNSIKFDLGYSFSTKPFYNTRLEGLTAGITFSFGSNVYCFMD